MQEQKLFKSIYRLKPITIKRMGRPKSICKDNVLDSLEMMKVNINMDKKGETLSKKMKRSPDESHRCTKTAHGNLTDIFQHSQQFFSIRRE